MKAMKRLASLLLVLLMAVSMMSVTAWATVDDKGFEQPKPTGAADEKLTATITLPPAPEGHTYAIYQIFAGNVAVDGDGNKVLSNVLWGRDGTQKAGTEVAADVLAALKATGDTKYPDANSNDTAQLQAILAYFNESATAAVTGVAGGSVTVPTGYYLIKDTTALDPNGDNVASLYMVEVVGDVTVTNKSGSTTVDKEILEGEDETPTKQNQAGIGDTITYQIVATLPDNYELFETFYLKFTDTLSKGLTYNKDAAVYYQAKDAETRTEIGFTVTAGAYSKTDGTIITAIPGSAEDGDYGKDLKAFLQDAGITAKGGDTIVIVYTATLNDDAVLGNEGNPNDVELEFSNDPNKSFEDNGYPGGPNDPNHPIGKTPKSEVRTFTTELEVYKVDGSTAGTPPLAGAEFTLTGIVKNNEVTSKEVYVEDPEGSYWLLNDGTYTDQAPDGNEEDYASTQTKYRREVVTDETGEEASYEEVLTTGEDGTIHFKGLQAGSYTLSETKTPAGFNTMKEITFDVVFTYDETTGEGTFTIANVKQGGEDASDLIVNGALLGTFKSSIENLKGTQLPSTGGIGTTIFYAVGGVLAVAAVILLITKRRMNTGK